MAGLSRYRYILFDLNGTLAFDHDRFGDDQDYHATYRAIGGRNLGPAQLDDIIADSLGRLIDQYENGPYDRFPQYRAFVAQAGHLPHQELNLVEQTVAEHEIGQIPRDRIELLRQLEKDHVLGIVSDLWAPAQLWRRHLASTGLDGLFSTLVFSCEIGAVKPDPKPFRTALDRLGADPAETLFVGNDLRRDVVGAHACGMHTAWLIGDEDSAASGTADYLLREMDELLRL